MAQNVDYRLRARQSNRTVIEREINFRSKPLTLTKERERISRSYANGRHRSHVPSQGGAMPRPALTRFARPASSSPPGRIPPHARSPPPAQVRDGRHVGHPTPDLQGLPQKRGRARISAKTSSKTIGGIDEENRHRRRIGDTADGLLGFGGAGCSAYNGHSDRRPARL